MQAVTDSVRRHRFSDDIIRRVRVCFEVDNWHGPLEVAEHWFFVIAWTWFSLWSWRNLSVVPAIAVYLLAIFFIGGRQRALAGILHGACHRTLMRNPTMGRIVSSVFAGYPLLQSFTGYLSSHVANHHARLGDPERDPNYVHFQQLGLCGENLKPEVLGRHLWRIATPRSTVMYVAYLVRDRIWNKDEKVAERCIRIAFLLTLIATAGVLWGGLGLGIVAAYWFLPLVTTQAWIGSLAELLDHYPLIESAPRVDLYVSRNREYGWLTSFLLGEKIGEQYHLVHHLFPRVPIWKLKEVHGILMNDPDYRAANERQGLFEVMRSLFPPLPKADLIR